MRITGVRLDGQHEIIFCNAAAFNLTAGALVKLQNLQTARVVIVPELLEVAQTDSNLPAIVEIVNLSAPENVVSVEAAEAAVNAVCQRQPCCVDWLTQFSGAVARLAPCCLEAESVAPEGQVVCAKAVKNSTH